MILIAYHLFESSIGAYIEGNVSGGNRITYANLKTLNQDHRMLIQGAQKDWVILHLTARF
jgi:hypothetical protein